MFFKETEHHSVSRLSPMYRLLFRANPAIQLCTLSYFLTKDKVILPSIIQLLLLMVLFSRV